MSDLVTAAEIAKRLKSVKRPQVVHDWRRRHADFPAPVLVKGDRVILWSWREIERWARATDRL